MAHRRSLVAVVLTACAGLVVAGCSAASNSRSGTSGDAANAKVTVLVAPSTARLQPRSDISSIAAPGQIALDAARGEREGAQLVATVRGGSPRLVMTSSTLVGPNGAHIAARHVRGYFEQVLRVEHGSPGGRSGEYTDPLVPATQRAVVLQPGQQLFAWVDVEAPVDAVPGVYRGRVELRRAGRSGSGATRARVAITLRVHAAALPLRPTLGSSIGVDASQIARFEHIELGSTRLRSAMDEYANVLADARLSTADVGVFPPGTLRGVRSHPGDDAYLERVFERRGVASVRIPFYMTSPFADPLGVDRPAALLYLRAAAAWARSRGLLERAYVYAIDEPDDSRAGELRNLQALLRQADPGLKLLVTREFGATLLRPYVDIFAPNISESRFHPADVLAAKRLGKATWWYPSITTQQPLPDLFVDDTRDGPRALGWLAWRYGVQGFLYWSATHWHEVEDPYRDSATYRQSDVYGNGDGVLLYPGRPVGHRGTPSPSIRLFELRDGIDDHDLLTMATCVATPAQATHLRTTVTQLAPSLTTFSTNATQVSAMRSEAFQLLDHASKQSRQRCQS